MCKVVYYVDGDNNPGMRTKGIKHLTEEATVWIYYASTNKYYSKEENRNAIVASARCDVNFVRVPAGKNSADIMIGMDAARDLAKHESIQGVVLVSADNDFNLIRTLLKNHGANTIIKNANTVEQGHEMMDMLTVETIQDMHQILVHKYGTQTGTEVYRRIQGLFCEAESEPKLLEAPLSSKGTGSYGHQIVAKVRGLFGTKKVRIESAAGR